MEKISIIIGAIIALYIVFKIVKGIAKFVLYAVIILLAIYIYKTYMMGA